MSLLSNLGFCGSYHDAQQLELSNIHHPQESTSSESFCQYIFDNADFNVSTVDGWNTFHSMGGIKCVTPAHTNLSSTKVKRLKSAPTQYETRQDEVGQLGVLELETLESIECNIFQQISVEDLSVLNPIPSDINVNSC